MKRVYLVHWNAVEAEERAARLEAAGYATSHVFEGGDQAARRIQKDLPDAVVIDLGRLPSHGRHMATWLRENRKTRQVPLVFVDGDPEKVEQTRQRIPDAVYTTWGRIRSALKRALAQPPRDVIVPPRPDYSGTPLARKLGIKAHGVLALLGAPAGFEGVLGELPGGTTIRTRAQGACNVLVLFATSRADLQRRFPAAHKALAPGGGLWIAWPKKTAGIASDLSQAEVRRIGMDSGLVDNKICAIDETWSGLRFMRRRKPKN